MSDEANFLCQQCGQQFSGPSEISGQTGICPNCGQETIVSGTPPGLPRFLVWKDAQQLGPFDQETVQHMMADGRIERDTLVCVDDGSIGWTPARDLFMTDGPSARPPLPGLDDARAESNAVARITLASGIELRVKAVKGSVN